MFVPPPSESGKAFVIEVGQYFFSESGANISLPFIIAEKGILFPPKSNEASPFSACVRYSSSLWPSTTRPARPALFFSVIGPLFSDELEIKHSFLKCRSAEATLFEIRR